MNIIKAIIVFKIIEIKKICQNKGGSVLPSIKIAATLNDKYIIKNKSNDIL